QGASASWIASTTTALLRLITGQLPSGRSLPANVVSGAPAGRDSGQYSFSFETVLPWRVTASWGNRGGVPGGPCIRASGVRQESHRRAAEDHFRLSRKAGRDWPVMPTMRTEHRPDASPNPISDHATSPCILLHGAAI